MNSDVHGILVGLAAVEARQAAMASQLDDQGERNIERFEALVDRLDERHEALLARIEMRERHILESLERLSAALPPLSARVDDLEKSRTKLVAIGTGGGMLATAVAWMAEHWLKLGQ